MDFANTKAIMKSQYHSPKPEVLYATDEQEKLGNRNKVKRAQRRLTLMTQGASIWATKSSRYTLRPIFEIKIDESRKERGHWGIRTPSPFFEGKHRSKPEEINGKGFELGQHGQTCNHRLQ